MFLITPNQIHPPTRKAKLPSQGFAKPNVGGSKLQASLL